MFAWLTLNGVRLLVDSRMRSIHSSSLKSAPRNEGARMVSVGMRRPIYTGYQNIRKKIVVL